MHVVHTCVLLLPDDEPLLVGVGLEADLHHAAIDLDTIPLALVLLRYLEGVREVAVLAFELIGLLHLPRGGGQHACHSVQQRVTACLNGRHDCTVMVGDASNGS